MSLVNGARFLEPSDMISTYFDRSSQSPLYLAVAVQQETTDTDDEALDAPFSKRRKCEVSQHHRFTEEQQRDVEMARIAPSPPEAAAMPIFIRQQEKWPVLNGRPYNNCGPPIQLFHPVFSSFETAMESASPLVADAHLYDTVRLFCQAAAQLYDTKDKRSDAIQQYLAALLGRAFIIVEAPSVKSDAVVLQSCGSSTAYLVILDLANEIGMGHADPCYRAGLAYRKYWADESHNILRKVSYCPSFIIAIAGPWLCVLGGIYLEKANVQPLTDYVRLNVGSRGEYLHVCRLFVSLRLAVSTLRDYYLSLESRLSPVGDGVAGFPFIENYGDESFSYMQKLTAGDLCNVAYIAKNNRSGHLLVVKFVEDYNTEAHRLLAAHGLAPSLHYAATENPGTVKYGDLFMIVMDYIEGATPYGFLSVDAFRQIKEAVDLLHSKDFVLGNLSLNNILIKGGKAMIIDFTWCNKAGEGRYPADFEPETGIEYPVGVGPNCIMHKVHDMEMLEKLYSREV